MLFGINAPIAPDFMDIYRIKYKNNEDFEEF